MVTNEAKRRAKILSFWEKHGLEATKEAFEIGRSTLFGWKKARKVGEGRMESLNPRSKRPKQVRRRNWPDAVMAEIRRLRTEHPNLGKEKIHIFLKRYCDERKLACPKPRTIGRIIADAPDKMRAFLVNHRPLFQKVRYYVHGRLFALLLRLCDHESCLTSGCGFLQGRPRPVPIQT